MKTTHTPGPWHVGVKQAHQIVYDASGWAVANATVYHGESDYEETKANARLIAAAPDLLEALDAMVEMYCSLVDSGDCGNWNPRNDKEVIQAMTAIAKARG